MNQKYVANELKQVDTLKNTVEIVPINGSVSNLFQKKERIFITNHKNFNEYAEYETKKISGQGNNVNFLNKIELGEFDVEKNQYKTYGISEVSPSNSSGVINKSSSLVSIGTTNSQNGPGDNILYDVVKNQYIFSPANIHNVYYSDDVYNEIEHAANPILTDKNYILIDDFLKKVEEKGTDNK